MKRKAEIALEQQTFINDIKQKTVDFLYTIDKTKIETILLSGSVARGDFFPGKFSGMVDLTVMKRPGAEISAEEIFGPNEEKYCLKYLNQVRKHGINAEIYPDAAKIQKQMKYADQRNIPIVIIAGEQEVAEQKFTVKWMKEGRQESVEANKLVETII